MPLETIKHNLSVVQQNVAAACRRCNRAPEEVTLVAVTKTVGVTEIQALMQLGIRDFGENRVAVAAEKADMITAEDVNWHLIGHLQRNKVPAIHSSIKSIHSVESLKLIKVLAKEAKKRGQDFNLFLEVNISGEESKYGISPSEAASFVAAIKEAGGLNLLGLMTMAPFTAKAEDTRPVFRGLKELQLGLQDELKIELPYLSMGMSNDYEVAIEEGATHIRVGSALFI